MKAPIDYSYAAVINSWIDGDTVDVTLDLGIDVTVRIRCRIDGINAPELHSPDPATKAKAEAAKAFGETTFPAGTAAILGTTKDKKEKYGRYLVTLSNDKGDYAELILAAGLAVPYHGGPR